MIFEVEPCIDYPDDIEEMTYFDIFERFPIDGWEDLYNDPEDVARSSLKEIDERLEELSPEVIFPKRRDVFNAFRKCPLDNVKVVIVGQDPYPRLPDACGLSFSVPKGVSVPVSLRNIYKELSSEYDKFIIPDHGDLSSWAYQGVLLLNLSLTFVPGGPKELKDIWSSFIYNVVKNIERVNKNCIFILWGAHAQSLKNQLSPRSIILEAAHPAARPPYNTFPGCNHFRETNRILRNNGNKIIRWGAL